MLTATRSRATVQSALRQASNAATWNPGKTYSRTSHCRDVAGSGKREEQKKKPGGSYTRIFGILGLSGAVGWGARVYQNDDDAVGKTTKPTNFVKYALTSKEAVSSTSAIFTLEPATGSTIDIQQLRNHRAITSVQFKQPQLQIARSYTVLPPADGQAAGELRCLIRKERNGEVSGYLHRLPIGFEIEVRGPSVDYVLPEEVDEVLFLAGGTGIAPALQVASKLADTADVQIIWANRRREDCVGGVSDVGTGDPPQGWLGWLGRKMTASSDTEKPAMPAVTPSNRIVAHIQDLQARSHAKEGAKGSLMVDYYVDEEGSFVGPADLAKLLNMANQREATRLILVSGPEGFINYWAGPKQWIGGREVQGPLGGALSMLNTSNWEVVKL